MLYVKVEVSPGTHVEDAARQAVEASHRLGVGVTFTFNDVDVPVSPEDTPESVVADYQGMSDLLARVRRRERGQSAP